jgi:hypothetical protein
MSLEFVEMMKDFVAAAPDDWIGLWEVVKVLEDNDTTRSPDEVKRLTLAFVEEMLRRGFVAGDPPTHDGVRHWKNQDHRYVIRRIDEEWAALGSIPIMIDIAWFDLPTPAQTG